MHIQLLRISKVIFKALLSDQLFITQKMKWSSSLPFGGPWGGTPGAGGIPIVGGTPIGGKPNGGCGTCGGGGCWGCGGGWGLRTSILHVGHVCCLWNHDRKQLVWNMWLQGSFLQPVVISSRHMMHTLSPCWSSSGVASEELQQGDNEVNMFKTIRLKLFSARKRSL